MATKVKITVSKGPQGVAGPQGFQGFQGPSAYEVWLSEGNSGTVQDYLDSLVGEQGVQGPASSPAPAPSVSVGTTTTGAAGSNASVVDGDSGTGLLLNFTVPQGATGPTGAAGAQGPQGSAGDISTSSIDDLNDVDTTTAAPTTGQALVWNNTNSEWEPGTIEGGVTSIVAGSGIGLSPTNGLGDVTVSANTSFDYARVIMGSDVLHGGASQQDFDSATAQRVKFNTSADTEGTGITIDTTNNRITVAATGYYQITSNISFFSNAVRTTPSAIFKVNGTTNLLGEGYGYIRAADGQNDNNNLITCVVELQQNDYVEVYVGDSSTRGGPLYAKQAFFEIISTGGATGSAGPQGPSGTTYSVVTLTGSTTLSSAHTTKYIVVNSSSNVNITVPASASYDANAEFVIEQRGMGSVTVVAASGVTVNSSESLVSGGQYAVMGLKRTASNVYTLTGERQAS
jgi:hypothetical protein